MLSLSSLLRRKPTREQLLNQGLTLAMDWGDDWLAPIQTRLRAAHRHLGAAELDALNADCQAAMRLGHETVHRAWHAGLKEIGLDSFAPALQARHPWIDADNLRRLLSQSIYYAAKTGGHGRAG